MMSEEFWEPIAQGFQEIHLKISQDHNSRIEPSQDFGFNRNFKFANPKIECFSDSGIITVFSIIENRCTSILHEGFLTLNDQHKEQEDQKEELQKDEKEDTWKDSRRERRLENNSNQSQRKKLCRYRHLARTDTALISLVCRSAYEFTLNVH